MGEVFAGRYELLDHLGEGGMGTVWRVWDSREKRIVAAKVLRQSDAVSLLRFVREQALRVVHPHVLTPLSWAGEDDRVLFTMPIVEGGSVATLIGDHGPLPPAFVAEILRQLGSGLEAVHAAGILHRDVKPANVLLAATGAERPHAFLTDFGIAIELDGVRLTQTGQWSGTPAYGAPESLSGAEPHPTADLYALGQVGIAMLTGAHPTPPPTRPDGTPDELWQLVTELIREDPVARPQSAGEVVRRLDLPSLAWDPDAMGDVEVLRQVEASADGVEPPERDRPSRRALLLTALVVLAALAAVLIWAPWSSDGEGPSEQVTTPSTPSTTTGAETSPSSNTPAPSDTQGSVGVGTVVVAPGQVCEFSDVGVHEETVDGVDVTCQRRDDGSYAWDPPPR
ncbi:serine/threonine-protein kinase [Janibacter sp. G1551]|uniref:serine/threonine-protein kinase n=1 Tax=Janibacter sp. G1551 TaxID=3420440 RepID=UPI003D040AB5